MVCGWEPPQASTNINSKCQGRGLDYRGMGEFEQADAQPLSTESRPGRQVTAQWIQCLKPGQEWPLDSLSVPAVLIFTLQRIVRLAPLGGACSVVVMTARTGLTEA